jgi:arylsulfatase A-like enzyme
MKKLLTLPLLVGSSLSLVANEKPNIIIIYVDDMAYADVSCYGGKFVETKNIDKLAEEGIRFTQYYSSAPLSSPSRVGLTTGMYPTRWGIRTFLQSRKGNERNQQNDFLSDKAPSMARVLKQNGYATGHFGKWHMGGGRDVDNAPSISSYGFDEYASTWESPDPDKLITASDWIWSDEDSVKRWDRTAYFVDKTLDFIKRNPNKPCFVNLWPDDVHTPFVPNPIDMETEEGDWEKPEAFKLVLKDFDIQIGRLMDGLKKLGVDQNTMVIFTSDNGPNPDYGLTRTGGLRGKKGTLYEGGIKMPFIVRWPKMIAPNQLNEKTVIAAVDLLPTLCKIAGAKLSDAYKIDGEDLSCALLSNQHTARKTPLFWEFNSKSSANRNSISVFQIAVRQENWKFLINHDGSNPELYDISVDPFEKSNLIDEQPKLAAEFKTKALQWFKKSFREFAAH